MNARSTYLNVACKGGQQKSGPKPASLRLRNSRSAGTFMVAAPSTGTNNRDVIGGSRGPSVRTFPRQKRDGQSLGSNCVHNKATDCRSSTFGFRMPTLCDRLSRGWGVWPRPQARCSSLSTQPSSVCPCTRRHRATRSEAQRALAIGASVCAVIGGPLCLSVAWTFRDKRLTAVQRFQSRPAAAEAPPDLSEQCIPWRPAI